jgi:hypothetical protein
MLLPVSVIVSGGRVLFKMMIVAGLISKKGVEVNEAYSDYTNPICDILMKH